MTCLPQMKERKELVCSLVMEREFVDSIAMGQPDLGCYLQAINDMPVERRDKLCEAIRAVTQEHLL